MGSALLNPAAQASAELAPVPPGPETPEELRRQVAARLAAHRERRLRKDVSLNESVPSSNPSLDPNKSRIAAAVAERYGKAQSYHAFLAAEAERAVQQARAAAEIAARNAHAIAEAQQRLLDDLAQQGHSEPNAAAAPSADTSHWRELPVEQALWPDIDPPPAPAKKRTQPEPRAEARPARARSGPPAETAGDIFRAETPALRVVLYDDTPAVSRSPVPVSSRSQSRESLADDPESLALDEEISFRQSPVFEEPAGPPMPLPANLIEFPRQLVASRKARPRYAEGPLRDEDGATSGKEQLRIFEVLPAQISTQPAIEDAGGTPEAQWTSLWLDAPGAQPAPAEPIAGVEHILTPASYVFSTPKLYTAKLSRRMLASAIDIAITAVAGIAGVAAFAATTGLIDGQLPWRIATLRSVAAQVIHTVPLSTLTADSIAALVLLSLTLQAIFFTLSDATPGMRLSRIALCTFSDDNPSRTAMRLRIPALVLSTALLGLGFWWALLDEDRLTWHDLISRMYPRSY